MNKKFLTILLALAMLISMVPMAAMAAETCPQGCTYGTETCDGEIDHITCEHGFEIYSWACKHAKSDPEPEEDTCVSGTEHCDGETDTVVCEHGKVIASWPCKHKSEECDCFFGTEHCDGETDTVVCEHGKEIASWPCKHKDDSKEEEPNVTEPEETTAPVSTATATVNPNLDSVPKTGSSFLEWLYALIFG